MAQTPTDAPTGYDADDHADFHNRMATITNQIDNEAASANDILQLVSGVWAPRTLTEAGISAVTHTHVEADILDLDKTDADAFHDDVSGEINALTAKGSPVSGDLIVIEDSAASYAKKKVQIGDLPTGGGGGSGVPDSQLVTSNTTLDSGDGVILVDSDGGTRTITLPQVSTVSGITYTIMRVGSNTVTIQRSGTDTIWLDGTSSTSIDLLTEGGALTVTGLSGVWYVLGASGVLS